MANQGFGPRLRKLRLEKLGRPLSLREAASRLGIAHPYLVQLEAGEERPSEELALRIAKFFGEDEKEIVYLARKVPELLGDIAQRFPAQAMATVAGFARDLFISHRTVDKPWVRVLATRLQNASMDGRGMTVWLDEAEIRPGQSVTGEINRGLETSRFIALVLTPDYFSSESGWTDAEWQAALFRDPTGRQARVIPLLVKDCPYIPVLLRHLGMIDFRSRRDYERSLVKLVSHIKNDAPPSPVASRGQIIAPSGHIVRQTLDAERAVSVARPDCVKEALSCNLLPILGIPEFVWSAPISRHLRGPKARRSVSKELLKAEIRRSQEGSGLEKPFMPAFVRHAENILSFNDLESDEGPLAPVVESFRARRLTTTMMAEDPDLHRLLMTLLNMSVQRHCLRMGLAIASEDTQKRLFFPAQEPGRDRRYSWRSSARPRTVTKFCFDASRAVKFCRHLAARLPVIYLGGKYYIRISPTWIFTKDGTAATLLRGPKLGVLAMRWTGRERNLQILYHTRFWAYVLSERRSIIRIRGGDQSMLVDTRPAFIRLPLGIEDDRANLDQLVYQVPDDFDWKGFELPEPLEEWLEAATHES